MEEKKSLSEDHSGSKRRYSDPETESYSFWMPGMAVKDEMPTKQRRVIEKANCIFNELRVLVLQDMERKIQRDLQERKTSKQIADNYPLLPREPSSSSLTPSETASDIPESPELSQESATKVGKTTPCLQPMPRVAFDVVQNRSDETHIDNNEIRVIKFGSNQKGLSGSDIPLCPMI